MVKVRALAERHIGWIVHSGNSNFWFDNWLGTEGLADRLDSMLDHKVADFVQSGSWDVRSISHWVPLDIVTEIGRIDPPDGPLPDLIIWRTEQSGRFTLKSAFSLVQHHSGSSPLFKRIWHQVVPLRVSFSFCACCGIASLWIVLYEGWGFMDLLGVRVAPLLGLRLQSICLVRELWHNLFGGFLGPRLE